MTLPPEGDDTFAGQVPGEDEGASRSVAVPGPDAVSRALLFSTRLQRADIDPQTRDRLLKTLGDVLPVRPLQPGTAGSDRTLTPDTLKVLIPSAAVVAAGLDPAKVVAPVPPVIWTGGANQTGGVNQLLVLVGQVRAELGNGAIVLTVPVSCDQTGPVDVTVSFITGTPDLPAAGVATTEDHPRGPAVIVENWAGPLIAYAWHVVLIVAGSLSSAGGNDFSGRDLITAGLAVNADGLRVTPMGRNTFLAAGLST